MPYQNISAVLDIALVNETVAKIQSSKNSLVFLINLDEDEKRNLPKMGDKSVSFVEKSLEYANQNPNLIPPYLDIPELGKDLALYKNLLIIFQAVAPFYEALSDTLTAVGSEAFTASLTFYNSSKNASTKNVPGANAIYNDLKRRFSGRPPKTTEPDNPN